MYMVLVQDRCEVGMVNQGTVLGTVRWYGGRVQRYGIGRYSGMVYGGRVQRCHGTSCIHINVAVCMCVMAKVVYRCLKTFGS